MSRWNWVGDLGQVLYVDFGNKEVVSKGELRVLDEELMNDPIQCYCCRLHNIVPVTMWFKFTVTVMETTINENKSNPLTVTVTVTESFINCNCNWNTCNVNIQLMPSWSTIRLLTYYLWWYVDQNCGLGKITTIKCSQKINCSKFCSVMRYLLGNALTSRTGHAAIVFRAAILLAIKILNREINRTRTRNTRLWHRTTVYYW